MAAVEEKTWECPKCGREFGSTKSCAGHQQWCGLSPQERTEKHPMYGKHHSAETRRKMSEARRGKKHPFYGKHHSAEHRRKLSEANRNPSAETRQKMSEAQWGKKHPFYGKHHSAETRQKMSEARRGAKNWNWRGGPFPYGSLWPQQRARTRARDNYTCQRCGIAEEELGHELSVHHIRAFRESHDNTLPNLICLCDTNDNGCHRHCEDHPEDCPEPRKHWLLTA